MIIELPQGIILKGVGGFYQVFAKDTQSLYTCKVRGVHRKQGGITPLPGDYVVFKVLDESCKEGYIDQILERRNSFVRPPVANIDQLAIVFSVTSPDPDLMLVDKLLITCLSKDIKPLMLINKADLDSGGRIQKLKEVYENTGFRILVLSKFRQEGYELLHSELAGYTTAFAGQSGVGKSTILNTILNNWVMETGDISERIQRGKHTTRHVEIFRLAQGGYILDTPGFSSYSIIDANHDSLDTFYPEFKDILGLCRFKGCSHTGEPDCAVRDICNKGKLHEARYNRYIELYRELKKKYDNRYRR